MKDKEKLIRQTIWIEDYLWNLCREASKKNGDSHRHNCGSSGDYIRKAAIWKLKSDNFNIDILVHS